VTVSHPAARRDRARSERLRLETGGRK